MLADDDAAAPPGASPSASAASLSTSSARIFSFSCAQEKVGEERDDGRDYTHEDRGTKAPRAPLPSWYSRRRVPQARRRAPASPACAQQKMMKQNESTSQRVKKRVLTPAWTISAAAALRSASARSRCSLISPLSGVVFLDPGGRPADFLSAEPGTSETSRSFSLGDSAVALDAGVAPRASRRIWRGIKTFTLSDPTPSTSSYIASCFAIPVGRSCPTGMGRCVPTKIWRENFSECH